eukprot:282544-Pleurochrysis_carterae.AAC.1
MVVLQVLSNTGCQGWGEGKNADALRRRCRGPSPPKEISSNTTCYKKDTCDTKYSTISRVLELQPKL